MMRQNRRGAILVLAAFVMVVVLSMFVVVVDLSRIFVQRNELQTSVDAGALAGVLELYKNPVYVDDSAISFGTRNQVLKLAPAIATAGVTCGVWDDVGRTFTASIGCNLSDNAVEVTGTTPRQASLSSFMSLGSGNVTQKATAWLAYVNGTKCVKPFGLPYKALTYAVRPDRANPIDPDPERALTPGDYFRLRTYPRDSLRFKLKAGSGSEDRLGPGNFGPLDLDGNSAGGGSDYGEDIENCDSTKLSVGSVIRTETGNMSGPTRSGVTALCQNEGSMVGDECRDADGNMGLPILAVLISYTGVLNGNSPVTVRQIGAFKLDSLNGTSVVGHFVGYSAGGSIGTVKTTLTRPILVK